MGGAANKSRGLERVDEGRDIARSDLQRIRQFALGHAVRRSQFPQHMGSGLRQAISGEPTLHIRRHEGRHPEQLRQRVAAR